MGKGGMSLSPIKGILTGTDVFLQEILKVSLYPILLESWRSICAIDWQSDLDRVAMI